MKETITTNNRQYLAFILAGGPGKSPFRQISCTINEAGQVLFSRAIERYGETGGGYNIEISTLDGRFELWLGNENKNDCSVIRFADPDIDPMPTIPLTPADVLESFRRWKSGPGVREIVTETTGVIIREFFAS